MERFRCLNTFTLKVIAIATMLIDHIGYCFFPELDWMRIVGRMAFPIFCFLLVEGFFHTHDAKKYMIRLGLFALISEIPFDLCFSWGIDWGSQNVFFALLIGFYWMYLDHQETQPVKRILGAVAAMLLADLLRVDYGSLGVVTIMIFYLLRQNRLLSCGLNAILQLFSGTIQRFAGFAGVFILLYNEKKGPGLKYLFYVFYPLHLIVFYIIERFQMM